MTKEEFEAFARTSRATNGSAWRCPMSDEDPRPEECCGKCPPLMRGGYDCTCRGNPRCQGAPTEPAVTPDQETAVRTVHHIAQTTTMTLAEVVATLKAISEPAVTVTDEMVERACLSYETVAVREYAHFAPMRAALEAALSTERGEGDD